MTKHISTYHHYRVILVQGLPFAIWIKYVIDEFQTRGLNCPGWQERSRRLSLSATYPGVVRLRLDTHQDKDGPVTWTAEELATFAVAGHAAVGHLLDMGVVRMAEIASWRLIDDHEVNNGLGIWTNHPVDVGPAVAVARGMLSLIQGSLAPEPSDGFWYFDGLHEPHILPWGPTLAIELPTSLVSRFNLEKGRTSSEVCGVRLTTGSVVECAGPLLHHGRLVVFPQRKDGFEVNDIEDIAYGEDEVR
jgi:hypothetical protein